MYFPPDCFHHSKGLLPLTACCDTHAKSGKSHSKTVRETQHVSLHLGINLKDILVWGKL